VLRHAIFNFQLNQVYMKKVFLISICMLAGLLAMTSCDEEENVALTGITVNSNNIKAAVGKNVRVVVKTDPENSTESVVYSWTSADEQVVKINEPGLLSIVGIGTTTVTVTGGSFTQTINVEGTIESISVKDAAGQTAGAYLYIGEDLPIQITATIVSAVNGIKPVWTTDASTVRVTPSADGLSAEVVIKGEGKAVITVAVGSVSVSYTVSTESLLDKAIGYWTFDDPDNLGKATLGADLKYVNEEYIEIVDGPSEKKKAVHVKAIPRGEGDKLDPAGFIWEHPFKEKEQTDYTILIDCRVPQSVDRAYYGIYRTNFEDGSPNYSLSFRPRDGALSLNHIGGTNGNAISPADKPDPGEEPWIRLVLRYEALAETPEGFPTHNYYFQADVNGISVFDNHDEKFHYNKIYPGYPVHFIQGTPERTGCKYSVSTIAVWDRVLTDAEVASLGGVSK
jgi:hypothetical protein